jgi:glycosyltransferase 2 family protein
MRRFGFRESARRHLRWVAAAAILGACGFYLVRQIDPAVLGRALSGADYRLVAAMTLGHLCLLLPLKAWRWQAMLAPMRRLRLATLYRYFLAGCAVTNLLPARAGHAARVVLVHRDGVPVAGAVGTLVLEEMCNMVVLGLICLPLPFLLELPRHVRVTLEFVTVGAAIGVAVAAWLALAGRARPSGLLRRVSEGVAVLGSARAAAMVFALSAGMWLLDLGQIALAMAAVEMPPSYAGVALVLLFVNLTNALPATPGQLGMFEAGAAAACIAVGSTPEQGLAVGVLYHMMQFIPETVLGLYLVGPTVLARAQLAAGDVGVDPDR